MAYYTRRYGGRRRYGRYARRNPAARYMTPRAMRRIFPTTPLERRRTVRRNRAPRSEVLSKAPLTGTRHGDKYVKSQADPFDEEVDGVKIPDSNAQPSVPLKCDDTYDLGIAPTQTCSAVAFNPSCSMYAVQGVAAGATSWTWTATFGGATDSSKLGQLRTDQEMFRPVAHGIRITSGLAPTAAVGFVHVCVFSQALYNQSTWAYPTSIALMQNVPGYKRIPIGRLTAEGLVVVNRCTDTTAQRYVDTDSPVYGSAGTMEFQSGLQWCSIIVAVTGAVASTVPITIENILHLECIPRATAISSATPAAKYNPGSLGGAANGNSATNPSALDSEKGHRKMSFLQNAVKGVQAAGGGKPTSAGLNTRFMADQLRRAFNPTPNASMAGGIRNVVSSSGML